MKKFIMFLLVIVGFCWCFSKGISVGKNVGLATASNQPVVLEEQPVLDSTIIKLVEHIAIPDKDISGTIFECGSFEELEEKVMKYVYEMAESEGTAIWAKD